MVLTDTVKSLLWKRASFQNLRQKSVLCLKISKKKIKEKIHIIFIVVMIVYLVPERKLSFPPISAPACAWPHADRSNKNFNPQNT